MNSRAACCLVCLLLQTDAQFPVFTEIIQRLKDYWESPGLVLNVKVFWLKLPVIFFLKLMLKGLGLKETVRRLFRGTCSTLKTFRLRFTKFWQEASVSIFGSKNLPAWVEVDQRRWSHSHWPLVSISKAQMYRLLIPVRNWT